MQSSANKAIANTLILYVRMFVTMGISLYSTRVVLNALGSTDYGIFTLIAGVISMLSFLNAAMSTSTQRYLSYYQGKKDAIMQKKIFSNSLFVHLVLGVVIVMLLEGSGTFLFNGILNLPVERISTAKIIFHYMTITVFFTVFVVPFTATLYARENMLWVAIVNTIEVLLRLGIAVLLLNMGSTYDKLVIYGSLTAIVALVSVVLYSVYCYKKYDECELKYGFNLDKSLVVQLTSFAGFNLFGSLCVVGRIEGVAILLNVFLGTVVNAAFGIANQVASQLNFLSATMLQAVNPQIMKSEGAGDRDRMLKLAMIASKFSFYLLSILAIPCIFEMKWMLVMWLKNVPNNSTIFCQLILLGTMINQLTVGLQSAIQATGKIKAYQLIVGTLVLCNLPLAYILLRLNYPAYSALITYAIIEVVACCLRLEFARKLARLSIKTYLSRVIFMEIIPVLVNVSACLIITNYFDFKFRFVFTIASSGLCYVLAIYLIGLCKDEKLVINNLILKYSSKMMKGLHFTTQA